MTDTINVPLLPTKVMLDAATSHALSVNIGGHYTWSDYMRDLYVLMITSTPAQPAPVHGWQMVPVEPSEKMLDILYHNGPGLSDHLLVAIWAELLAAAPKPPVQQCEAPSCGCADAYCKAWDEAPQPSDDAKDAARYRFLKSKCDTGFITNLEDNVFVSRWDVAIDAAMEGSKGDE